VCRGMKKWLIVGVLFLTACGGVVAAEETATSDSGLAAQDTPSTPTAAETPVLDPPAASATSRPTSPTPRPSPEERLPSGAEREFKTDFSNHTVPYDEILSGGPPKDGIPAIDAPQFVSVNEADDWLEPQEPVVLFEIDDDARAYPIQILMWHEIINDAVGGVPVTVTFCPLCNTAIAFERTFDGQVLDFGTTGRLRFSNLIMYDRQTETWWQQASGEGIAGQYAGRRLTFLPAAIISWDAFKSAHPEGQVLSRETGFQRDYGRNPYTGYDDVNRSPFLYDGPATPGQLPAMARVLTIDLNGEAVAYPYDVMQMLHVANDRVGDRPVAVFWAPGTASALDGASVASGRDVGALVAFSRQLDGEVLQFIFEDGKLLDRGTRSEWDLLGTAVDGPLAGEALEPVVSVNHFWFSWAAFKPNTRVFEGS
jgi:hypothetical protein